MEFSSFAEIDPKKFAPVEIFHDITVMKENISYHTNGNSRLPLENQDSYVSMNPVDLEQHVYESISDTEDVVHSSTNSKNYILSTSRETTI